MGEAIGLPQLVQQLLLLHGGGRFLLAQAGHLGLQPQQLVAAGLALPGGPDPPGLQLQPGGIQPLQLLGAPAALLPQGSQGVLLLLDLLGEALVLRLILGHQALALGPVPRQALPQGFQLTESRLGGLPLRF